mgnify:CR=1 FL=1
MKTSTYFLFFCFLILSTNSFGQHKNKALNDSIKSQIELIRKTDKMGFDEKKNKQIYTLLNYPDVGFADTLNGLTFELILKKDTTGFYKKGISWIIRVDNFSDNEENWETIRTWSNQFSFDMTALNEFFYIIEPFPINTELNRIDLIFSFIEEKKSKTHIIALREINEDRNTFEKYPFKN